MRLKRKWVVRKLGVDHSVKKSQWKKKQKTKNWIVAWGSSLNYYCFHGYRHFNRDQLLKLKGLSVVGRISAIAGLKVAGEMFYFLTLWAFSKVPEITPWMGICLLYLNVKLTWYDCRIWGSPILTLTLLYFHTILAMVWTSASVCS